MAAMTAIEKCISQSGLFNPNKYVDFSIVSRARPALFGLSMYQMLSDSKVTLNTHIDISSEFASNMRLFEATGVGTCLLTEKQANLKDIFEPNTEVVTYSCPQEAVENANYLLVNADQRNQIAEAGQQRTIKNHTFDQRAIEIDQMIRKWSR
jgi:spore maturation protein CgeB